MDLWSHCFSQNMDQKMQGFLPCCVAQYRAEIITIFSSYFGRNDNFINSFWNLLTFKGKKNSWSIVITIKTRNCFTYWHFKDIGQQIQLWFLWPGIPSSLQAFKACFGSSQERKAPSLSNLWKVFLQIVQQKKAWIDPCNPWHLEMLKLYENIQRQL